MSLLKPTRPRKDRPLSLANTITGYPGGLARGDSRWLNTPLGELWALTGGGYIKDIKPATGTEYVIRVLDAWTIFEDSSVSKIYLLDETGNLDMGYLMVNGHPHIGDVVTSPGFGHAAHFEDADWPSETIWFGSYQHPHYKHGNWAIVFGLFPEAEYIRLREAGEFYR